MSEFVLLFNLGFMVIAAAFSLFIARALNQPALLGYLLAGVIIGPFGLNLLSDPGEITILSELGIIFLLFTVGAETDFLKFVKAGPTILLGGFSQVLLTMLITFFVLPNLSFEAAIYVGLALALSSTILVVKILQDKKTLQSLHGQIMLGFLLVQDLAIVVALPLLAAGNASLNVDFLQSLVLKGILLVALVALLSKKVFPLIFRWSAQNAELLYITALATCFGFIALAYALNISLAIGAFLAGLAIAKLPYNVEAVSSIRGLRDFFVMLFFVSLGTQLSFSFGAVPLLFIVSTILMVLAFKPLVIYIITQLAGYGSSTSVRVSFGLTQMSEFSLILLLQGRVTGVIPENIYSFLLLVVAASMVVTPYVMETGPWVHGKLKKWSRVKIFSHFPIFSRRIEAMQDTPSLHMRNHIIVMGGGRSGKYLAIELSRKHPVIVVDHDPNIVAYFRAKGQHAIYGNAHNTEILEKLHAEKAKLLICALPDVDETMYVVNFVKHHFPQLKIFAKAEYYEEALRLYRAGVDYVVLTEIIGGAVYLEHVEFFLRHKKVMEKPNMIKLKAKAYEEREATHGVKNLL
ncbi:MAG: cation:proton antiporter [Candidatus Diapherotrites archaeon]